MTEIPAPLAAASVTLAVRDLPGTARFYETLLGLRAWPAAGGVTLAAGARPLLHLRHAPEARPESGREPGLFHAAFLLPHRASLAAWLHHAAALGIALQGASDHGVSEAIYLADPEGNGIEVYADRPRDAWPVAADGQAATMFTRRLDLRALMATVPGPATPGPATPGFTTPGFTTPDFAIPGEATRLGHVHLRVGAVPEAEAFYRALGMAVMQRVPQASFLSTGGYHHHVAVNSWASQGSPRRQAGLAGLLEVELRAADAGSFAMAAQALRAAGGVVEEDAGTIRGVDPAGNGVRVSRGE